MGHGIQKATRQRCKHHSALRISDFGMRRGGPVPKSNAITRIARDTPSKNINVGGRGESATRGNGAVRGNPQSAVRNPQSVKGASAFTLIELLVVVAIIVIIVGIAIPSLDAIGKSGEYTQVVAQFNTLFASAYSSALGAEASADSRPASGILFMRARPGDNPMQFALDHQRAVSVTFKPYDVRNPATGFQMVDPSSFTDAPTQMTYDTYFEYHPYFRPIEDIPGVDLPKNVWVAPDFFDTNRPGVNGFQIAVPDNEYYDANMSNPRNRDSRLDRFMITFAPGGETFETQTSVNTNGNDPANQLVFRPSPTARWRTGIANEWLVTGNPVSARGVVVYDREAMLERDQGADRRDFITETGRALFLSRLGAQTRLGEGF